MIFGISFCAVNEAADSFRYVKEFMIEKDYTIYQYTDKINEYLTFETNIKDIYTLTINFLVGRFTDNYHWTYFIYSIILYSERLILSSLGIVEVFYLEI